MPAALDVPWPTIKLAIEAGADEKIVADEYDILLDTLQKRMRRENWITPKKVAEKLEAQKAVGALVREQGSIYANKQDHGASLAKPKNAQLSVDFGDPHLLREKMKEKEKLSEETAAQLVVETWATRGDKIRDQAWLLAQKSLAPAIASGVMVTSAKEAATMIKIARDATGQFQESNTMFNVSIFGNGEESIGSVIEVDSSPVMDVEDDGEWC